MRGFLFHRLGLLGALVALAVQLGLGGSVPNEASAFAVSGIGVICHAEGEGQSAPAPAQHHVPDCALCPLCASLAAPAPLLAAPARLPRPQLALIADISAPPFATGPPAALLISAQPRGPPVLT